MRMTTRVRYIALLGAIAAVVGAVLASTATANTAGNAIKLGGAPSSIKYGASFTATVFGHGRRVGGLYHPYPPNLVAVDVLTSRSPRCPKRPSVQSHQSNLRQVLTFHSHNGNQALGQFSRTVRVTADGKTYGLCAYLLNFPTGHTYAHAAKYWKVSGIPAPPPKYILTVSTSGTLGEVDSSDFGIYCGNGGTHCSHAYAPGTNVMLTEASQPEPPISSTFAGWGGACSGTGVTCTVTMDSNKTVTATFEPTPQ